MFSIDAAVSLSCQLRTNLILYTRGCKHFARDTQACTAIVYLSFDRVCNRLRRLSLSCCVAMQERQSQLDELAAEEKDILERQSVSTLECGCLFNLP